DRDRATGPIEEYAGAGPERRARVDHRDVAVGADVEIAAIASEGLGVAAVQLEIRVVDGERPAGDQPAEDVEACAEAHRPAVAAARPAVDAHLFRDRDVVARKDADVAAVAAAAGRVDRLVDDDVARGAEVDGAALRLFRAGDEDRRLVADAAGEGLDAEGAAVGVALALVGHAEALSEDLRRRLQIDA